MASGGGLPISQPQQPHAPAQNMPIGMINEVSSGSEDAGEEAEGRAQGVLLGEGERGEEEEGQ